MNQLRWIGISASGSLPTSAFPQSPPPADIVAGFTFPSPLPPGITVKWTLRWTAAKDTFGNTGSNPSPTNLSSQTLNFSAATNTDGELLVLGELFNAATYERSPTDYVLKLVYVSSNFVTYAPGSISWSSTPLAPVGPSHAQSVGTVYFLDEFDGSGPLDCHVPEVNVAKDAAWAPRSTNNSSGRSWRNSGGALQLVNGLLTNVNATNADSAAILSPGRSPVAPYSYNPYPPEVYTGKPFKVSFSLIPKYDSSVSILANKQFYPGTTGFAINNSPGATKLLEFYNFLVPVSYTAGVVYDGSIEVNNNEDTLQFMGQTLVAKNTGNTFSNINFADFYVVLGPGDAMGFMKVESLSPNLFWTQKVGCTES